MARWVSAAGSLRERIPNRHPAMTAATLKIKPEDGEGCNGLGEVGENTYCNSGV